MKTGPKLEKISDSSSRTNSVPDVAHRIPVDVGVYYVGIHERALDMKTTPEIHANNWMTQRTGRPTVVYGHLLEPGDILEANDVYDSTSGEWSPCPCPGVPLGQGTMAKWVRPLEIITKT